MPQKYTVIIIEDDVSIRELYKYKLELENYEVKTADNGQMGLELCKQTLPDLILLDLKMPVMNGDVMLEKLRETEWGSKIRVIVLTNISKDEAPRNLHFLHVDRYIVKAHYTPMQVAEIIKEVLNPKTNPPMIDRINSV